MLWCDEYGTEDRCNGNHKRKFHTVTVRVKDLIFAFYPCVALLIPKNVNKSIVSAKLWLKFICESMQCFFKTSSTKLHFTQRRRLSTRTDTQALFKFFSIRLLFRF